MKKVAVLLWVWCYSLLLWGQQLDKEQEKIWREKLEKTSVEEFKAISEANSLLPARISKAKKELAETQALVSAKDEEINLLQKRLQELEKELGGKPTASANSTSNNKTEPINNSTTSTASKENFDKGVVFRLQIAASDKLDLSVSNEYDLRVEQDGKIKKYTLGNFRNFEKADSFKNCLPEIGVKGGWIVAYKDGVRVPLKEVK
ncbi:hypothetical protein [Raineya orbicola]|jgi:hypothetical protein|uniref:Ezrin/radixin/moesin family protein n=1 Tax=Raineya orbicola TaxID=2016530 RepID=A0A2N3IKC9_9BACT|nr:hypothetical protein [Raineya orbicola]PKQ70790.1 hypothetical protein Rain11_0136 [Raineya orbicola]